MNQQTSGFNVQDMVGSHAKDTKAQAIREAHPKLFYLLDAAPLLAFSEVGRGNICRRFQISEQMLDECLQHYLRPGEPETEQARCYADLQRVMTSRPELLDATDKVIVPRKRSAKQPANAKEGQSLND
jgi:hypothetical protein